MSINPHICYYNYKHLAITKILEIFFMSTEFCYNTTFFHTSSKILSLLLFINNTQNNHIQCNSVSNNAVQFQYTSVLYFYRHL